MTENRGVPGSNPGFATSVFQISTAQTEFLRRASVLTQSSSTAIIVASPAASFLYASVRIFGGFFGVSASAESQGGGKGDAALLGTGRIMTCSTPPCVVVLLW